MAIINIENVYLTQVENDSIDLTSVKCTFVNNKMNIEILIQSHNLNDIKSLFNSPLGNKYNLSFNEKQKTVSITNGFNSFEFNYYRYNANLTFDNNNSYVVPKSNDVLIINQLEIKPKEKKHCEVSRFATLILEEIT